MVAKKKRVIASGSFYDKYFPAATNSDPILNKDGSVEDTVELCKDIVNKTLADTKQIAAVLKRSTLEQTAQALFNFLYRHYQYKEDKPGVEQLRRPARAWQDRKTGVDCDCFSITISSILTNLGIPHAFRIVKMYGRNHYQHIYVVIPKEKGADLSRRSNYIVIDPVLDHFDYEAPGITAKKDYAMNGIPIQYLNGLGCAGGSNPRPTNGLMGFGNEFEGLGMVIYIPDVEQQRRPTLHRLHPHRPQTGMDVYRDLLRRKKRHLINTRNIIAKHPHTVANCYKPRVLLGMIDELIGVWDNDQYREATLDKLSTIEHEALIGGMNGLGALGGFFDKLKKIGNQIKEGVKKGAKWVGDAAKKVKEVILKYNPLSIAARAGFRAAMHLNVGYLANRAYWGYFSQAEAKAKNVSASYWNKAKELKDKMEHVFVDILKGDGGNLRNDILKGGAKRAAGGNLRGTQGLGIAVEASITAAMAFLAPLINVAKSIFGKGGDDSGNTADNGPAGDNSQANNAADPGSNGGGSDNFNADSGGPRRAENYANRKDDNPDAGSGGDTMPNNNGNNSSGGGISNLFKGNNKKLLLYGALAAGAILLLSKSSIVNPPPAPSYTPPPQPMPAPGPAPQPQYAQPMAGVKRRKKKTPERHTTKKAVKTIQLS